MNFSSAEALTEMGHSGTTQLVDTIKIKVPSSVHGKKKECNYVEMAGDT